MVVFRATVVSAYIATLGLALLCGSVPSRADNLVLDVSTSYQAMLIGKHATSSRLSMTIELVGVNPPILFEDVFNTDDDLQKTFPLCACAAGVELGFRIDVSVGPSPDDVPEYTVYSDDALNPGGVAQVSIQSFGSGRWLVLVEDLLRDGEDLDVFGDFNDMIVAIYPQDDPPFPLCEDAMGCGLAIPVVRRGAQQDKKDVLFIPDRTDYRISPGFGRAIHLGDFLADVNETLIPKLLGKSPLDANTEKFNFYVIPFRGKTEEYAGGGCDTNEPPIDAAFPWSLANLDGNWDEFYAMGHAFSDCSVIVHTTNFRDCSNGNGHEASTWTGELLVNHELGHCLFGLTDEYCIDKNDPATAAELMCMGDDCKKSILFCDESECIARTNNETPDCRSTCPDEPDPACDMVKSPQWRSDADPDIMRCHDDMNAEYGADCRARILRELAKFP